MEQEYIILGIYTDASYESFKNLLCVHANPVINSFISERLYSPSECEETVHFLFPYTQDNLKRLDYYGRRREIWMPDTREFKEAQAFDNNTLSKRTLYIHNSVFAQNNNNPSSRLRITAIKVYELQTEYESSNKAVSYRTFLVNKVKNNDNGRFLAWLFNDESLLGKSLSDLPSQYAERLNEFVNSSAPGLFRNEKIF